MKTNWMKSWIYAALTASCLVMLTESLAAAQSYTTIPSQVMDSFIRDTSTWWGQLRNLALSIFTLTLTIDICLFGIRMALQQSNLGEIFGQFISLLLFACFIAAVINNYEDWAKAVAIRGLDDVAQSLSSSHATLDKPAEIAYKIWKCVERVVLDITNPSEYIKLLLALRCFKWVMVVIDGVQTEVVAGALAMPATAV